MKTSLKRSLDCLTWGVLMVLLTWPAAAVGQVINLFENQDAMPEGPNGGHRYSSAARREMSVRLVLFNRSPDPVTNVEVEMTCQSATGSVQSSRGRVAQVKPGAPVEVNVRATISDCEDVQARIVEARW